jgi:hypothetical protein
MAGVAGAWRLITGFLDYLWPRVVIYAGLYWLAVLLGMVDIETEWFDVRALAGWLTRFTSLQSVVVFLGVAGFFGLLELVCRLTLARRGRIRHWLFVRANRLSVVGLEMFLGLLGFIAILAVNILVHLALLGDAGVLAPEDRWLRGDQSRNCLFSLAGMVMLYAYKLFVVGREDLLTRRFQVRQP